MASSSVVQLDTSKHNTFHAASSFIAAEHHQPTKQPAVLDFFVMWFWLGKGPYKTPIPCVNKKRKKNEVDVEDLPPIPPDLFEGDEDLIIKPVEPNEHSKEKDFFTPEATDEHPSLGELVPK